MTVKDFVQLVNSVSYKNWNIHIMDGWAGASFGNPYAERGTLVMRFYHEEPDSCNPAYRADAVNEHIVKQEDILRWTRDEAVDYIRDRILDGERHEFQEFFKVGGVQAYDAHPELTDSFYFEKYSAVEAAARWVRR